MNIRSGDSSGSDTSGTLDEALQRLHSSGPERDGWLSNHAPMAVEALVRHGQAPLVHHWIDRYRDKLEDMPSPSSPVTDAGWPDALGDPRRLTDWTLYFTHALRERPWRDVLAQWWPRLLPGIPAAATHGVIRVGHAVRTLLDGEVGTAGAAADSSAQEPRRTELAHALGYWAARHQPLPEVTALPAVDSPADGLAAVPRVEDQDGGIRERLAQISRLPAAPVPEGEDPEHARALLQDTVRAATLRYATHAHGSAVMLVHAATAPNAVLRTLPALPRELWLPSLHAAWSAAAAVTAAYAPPSGTAPLRVPRGLTPEEVFEQAAVHGDEHSVKLTDTAVDVASWERDREGQADVQGDRQEGGESSGEGLALSAALRSMELIDPLG
ncbi:hypothetical protein GCM10012287_00920 [Streptomyces daqingensis]|uniref:DUF4243 domain-containing protein n=1 Tax=Streptomyces daqingensis TaxID=1472640 RepID=A0ABQ2LQB8_9ACTN|nr:questin oxidase family protein [Streptomyces daqingensis]GGO41683.1 hypothetical protein GCM10012287_00920 [Streptomyces daqingensis]